MIIVSVTNLFRLSGKRETMVQNLNIKGHWLCDCIEKQLPWVIYKKDVLKKIQKFYRKHLCWSNFLN